MSNVVDGRRADAQTLPQGFRPSDRVGAVVVFATVAFTFALVAVFLTAALRNAPSAAADSDVSAVYGP
jgi:hypothetical protein